MRTIVRFPNRDLVQLCSVQLKLVAIRYSRSEVSSYL